MLSLAIKDSLISFDRLTQLSLSRLESGPLDDLIGENRFFLSFDIPAKTCFFLKPFTSFLDKDYSILPIVSSIPPNQFIFFAIISECLSKYYFAFTFGPFGCYKNISWVFKQLQCSLSITGLWIENRTVFINGFPLAIKSL